MLDCIASLQCLLDVVRTEESLYVLTSIENLPQLEKVLMTGSNKSLDDFCQRRKEALTTD